MNTILFNIYLSNIKNARWKWFEVQNVNSIKKHVFTAMCGVLIDDLTNDT